MAKAVTIVIPVYADWPSLSDCLDSLIKTVDLKKHKVLIVNDCGPEVDELEKKIKAVITNKGGFEYHRNPKNLGFVKTCNRAVKELDKTDNDILLLNSDTEVTAGFLEEMTAVMASDKKIGTVTPRTNNATIATTPISAIREHGIKPAESYKIFKAIKDQLPRYDVMPTGHGFCLLIRLSLTKKYGLFDPIFGRGYGEEVDFCRRLKGHGYKSVLANRAYVFHHEARSFSLEQKRSLIVSSSKVINSRYPNYSTEVRTYIEHATSREEKILSKTGIKLGRTVWFKKYLNNPFKTKKFTK